MDTRALLDTLLEADWNKSEIESLKGMIARAVELYGVERFWQGACSSASALPEDIKENAKQNAIKAIIEQVNVICDSCPESDSQQTDN